MRAFRWIDRRKIAMSADLFSSDSYGFVYISFPVRYAAKIHW